MTYPIAHAAPLCALLAAFASGSVQAQSRQRIAVQGSAFTTVVAVDGARVVGVGFEPQLRVNGLGSLDGGALSLGLGAQYTQHTLKDGPLSVVGAFVEPRVSFRTPSARWFAYGSARVAALQSYKADMESTRGFAFGAGGGVIRWLSPTVNLDLGGSALYQQLNDSRTDTGRLYRFGGGLGFVARVGLNVGLP
jgi:hypothetical protein